MIRATLRHVKTSSLVLLSIVTAACSGGDGSRDVAPTDPVSAEIATASLSPVADSLEVTGTVQPLARVVLAPKVMGRIVELAADEGDFVRKGQILVKIDDAELKAALAQAEAGVEAASAGEENAAAQRDRMRGLESRMAATRKNREDAETGLAVAAAQRRQAVSAVEAARAMLALATLNSPIAGTVTSRLAEVGDMAAPGRPLLTIDQTGSMKVEAALPETEAFTIRVGTPVAISFDQGGLAPRRSVVSAILPPVDPATRTILARVVLDDPNGSLRPGSFARLAFERGERRVLMIPRTALVERGALAGIYVVSRRAGAAAARLRWVRPGTVTGGSVEILGGLAEGEEYLPRPPSGIRDGSLLAEAR